MEASEMIQCRGRAVMTSSSMPTAKPTASTVGMDFNLNQIKSIQADSIDGGDGFDLIQVDPGGTDTATEVESGYDQPEVLPGEGLSDQLPNDLPADAWARSAATAAPVSIVDR